MSSDPSLYQSLDTTFVNLWSLLRRLTEQGFIGRVHVELRDYSADVFLDGSATPLVREIDRASNTEKIEEGGLHRVVLRTRGTPGTINLFAGTDEATPPLPRARVAVPSVSPSTSINTDQSPTEPAVAVEAKPSPAPAPPLQSSSGGDSAEEIYRTGSYDDWPVIIAVSGEMIAAVERGINSAGGDFGSLFRAARLELADDYVFLDPIAQTFAYSGGMASLRANPPLSVFVAGLSEALGRTIDRVAIGDRARRVRERVALELLPVARTRREVLERSGLRPQLDRIAGTRVM